MTTERDYRYMARALQLAERGLYSTDPNPRVGCVIAVGEHVVGEGWTDPVGGPHAEINALRAAGPTARGATAYVTLEPCAHHGRTPPCTQALIDAGIRRVVCAVSDPNPLARGGIGRLREAGIGVDVGVLEGPATRMNDGFIKRMRTGVPRVVVKIATSLDGRIALRNGVSRWITGAAARADVHRLRARSSAVMTGTGTVLADDPRLTVRADDVDLRGRIPLRVVCDTHLRVPEQARLFQEPGRILIYTAVPSDDLRAVRFRERGAEVITVGTDESGRLDLKAVLEDLAARECNEVLVEAGPVLSGRLLSSGLADALVVYMSPVLLGHEAIGMLNLPAVEEMSQRLHLRMLDVRQVGDDLRLTYEPPTASGAK